MPQQDAPVKLGSFNYSLNGFRGLCCGIVMLGHLIVIAEHQALIPPDLFRRIGPYIIPAGHGVELFFMISGFLIPASLKRHGNVGRFLADRALRILPVFVFIHFLVFTIGPLIHYKWMVGISHLQYFEYFFANLFLVQDVLGLPIAQQNAWSLTYEVGFYLVSAALYFCISRKSKAMVLVILAVALCMVAIDLRFLYFFYGYLCSLLKHRSAMGRLANNLTLLVALPVFFYCAHYLGEIAAIVPALVAFAAVIAGNSFFNAAIFQFLGNISYSLYLWHPIMILGATKLVERLSSHNLGLPVLLLVYCILGLALSLAMSYASYRLIEKWLSRKIRRACLTPSPPTLAAAGNGLSGK